MDFELSISKARRFLLRVWALLIVGGLAAEFSRHVLGASDNGLVDFFSLSCEGNLTTWAVSAILLLCALQLTLITILKRSNRAAYVGHWGFLACAFFYISLDETAQIHEHASDWFDLNGAFYYGWVIPAGIVVLLIGLCYLKFLWHLSRRSRIQFMIAGATYVGGALGVEMGLGLWADSVGDGNFIYSLIDLVEEGMEILGATLFLFALAEYISRDSVCITFHLGERSQTAGCGVSSEARPPKPSVFLSRRAILCYFVGMFLIGSGAYVWDARQSFRESCNEAIKKQMHSADKEDVENRNRE